MFPPSMQDVFKYRHLFTSVLVFFPNSLASPNLLSQICGPVQRVWHSTIYNIQCILSKPVQDTVTSEMKISLALIFIGISLGSTRRHKVLSNFSTAVFCQYWISRIAHWIQNLAPDWNVFWWEPQIDRTPHPPDLVLWFLLCDLAETPRCWAWNIEAKQ